MKIKLDDLNTILTKLIEKIKNEGFFEIKIIDSWYWHICNDSMLENKDIESNLGIGSFKDDFEGLKRLIANDYASFVDFDRFAFIIISIELKISGHIEQINKDSHPIIAEIKLKELSKILIQLIKAAKILGFEEVELMQDSYKKICIQSLTDITKDPEICTGSLVNDFTILNKILHNKEKVSLYDFERFAYLLIAVKKQLMQ